MEPEGSLEYSQIHKNLHTAVAYPGILFGGGEVQQIQLRTERMGIGGR
jgi:hypothetical protein